MLYKWRRNDHEETRGSHLKALSCKQLYGVHCDQIWMETSLGHGDSMFYQWSCHSHWRQRGWITFWTSLRQWADYLALCNMHRYLPSNMQFGLWWLLAHTFVVLTSATNLTIYPLHSGPHTAGQAEPQTKCCYGDRPPTSRECMCIVTGQTVCGVGLCRGCIGESPLYGTEP